MVFASVISLSVSKAKEINAFYLNFNLHRQTVPLSLFHYFNGFIVNLSYLLLFQLKLKRIKTGVVTEILARMGVLVNMEEQNVFAGSDTLAIIAKVRFYFCLSIYLSILPPKILCLDMSFCLCNCFCEIPVCFPV